MSARKSLEQREREADRKAMWLKGERLAKGRPETEPLFKASKLVAQALEELDGKDDATCQGLGTILQVMRELLQAKGVTIP